MDMDNQQLQRDEVKLESLSITENPKNVPYGLINTYYEQVLLCPDETAFQAGSLHPRKCDKNLNEFIDLKFDYPKFSKYLQAQCLIERQKRIRLIEMDEHVLQTRDLTDEILLKELTDIYGSLDASSEYLQKIFANYKLERIEQIETWCKEEEEYNTWNKTDAEEKVVVDEHIDLTSLFTQNELQDFDGETRLDLADHFVLPRPIPSILDVTSKKKRDRPGLNKFDPELHMPFVIPPICEIGVGELLAREMYQIIKSHPTGITCGKFVTEFEKLKSYSLNPHLMNYKNFNEMIDDLSQHVIFAQKCDRHIVLHPMFLQGLICSLDDAFFHIYHKIKFVLNLSYGILKVNEILGLCERIFAWKTIDFKAWNFGSQQDFVLYLINRWKTDKLAVVSEEKIMLNGNPQTLYLLELTESRKALLKIQERKIFNSKHQNKPSFLLNQSLENVFNHSDSAKIPHKFMQCGQSLPDEMSKFKDGDVLFMVVTYHVSPTDFYMVQNESFSLISELSNKLKLYCEQEEKVNGPQSLLINSSLISPGYCCILIDENGEYNRAQYLKKEGDNFRCRLLDYGDTVSVDIQRLRYLDAKLGTKIPVQAFHCRLMDVVAPEKDCNNGTDIWDDTIKDFSYNLLVPDIDNPSSAKVFLKLLLLDHSSPGQQRQWVVWMCDRKRKIKDFGAEIMNFMHKNCSRHQEYTTKKEQKSTPKVLKTYSATPNTQFNSNAIERPMLNIGVHPFISAGRKTDVSLEDFPPLEVNTSTNSKPKSTLKQKELKNK